MLRNKVEVKIRNNGQQAAAMDQCHMPRSVFTLEETAEYDILARKMYISEVSCGKGREL